MPMPTASVITDSISPQGIRLLTFKLRYPWMIHGELMTHRCFSRNASSNRAIPLARMLEEARDDSLRAEPVFWGSEQKGMGPGAELDDIDFYDSVAGRGKTRKGMAKHEWRSAALWAADRAEALGKVGTHKSIANRLLMPFTHANVVVTATEWDNFFGLRLAADAEPTMRALAVAMWEAQKDSEPDKLKPGEWHLPFIDEHDLERAPSLEINELTDTMRKVSVARCARVSYESHETGKRSTVEADLRLYDQLSKDGHWSPFEHQATPDEYIRISSGVGHIWLNQECHGNLHGWRQYRKMMPGESVKALPEGYP